MLIYERELDKDIEWALFEGGAHFEGRSAVQKATRTIADKLSVLGVSYALTGAMAMFFHGYRRFTVDVDVVVSESELSWLRDALLHHGYTPDERDVQSLRRASSGVRIDVCTRPIVNLKSDFITIDCIRVLSLNKLIESKLIAGSMPGRLRHLGDVQEMIKVLKLPRKLCDRIDPVLRNQYLELWQGVADAPPGPDQ